MDVPTSLVGSVTFDQPCLFGNFVTDNAANNSATNCSGGTATGQYGTTYRSGTGADGGVLSLRRHAGAGAETKQGDYEQGIERDCLDGFHGINPLSKSCLTPDLASVITC